MSSILTPQLANIEDHNDNSATFIIEPLHTGYGMTLGNSIRRVLLSSVSGAAITSFKIEGASHEFTAVEGVKEDVVDIMLNLKQVRFRVFSDEPQELQISASGGSVTAKDIATNADVEVVNPDQVIATLDGKAKFNMTFIVETGRGYLSVEERSADSKPSDMIALDAIFSPIRRVRYTVNNTRVGQITNLDKLVLSVDTDGSISAHDAFEQANAVLVAQYQALAGSTTVELAPPAQVHKPVPAEEEEETDEMKTPIDDLNLSARTTNALINNDIHTVQDLISLTDSELKELKGFGAKALDEVQHKLTELDL